MVDTLEFGPESKEIMLRIANALEAIQALHETRNSLLETQNDLSEERNNKLETLNTHFDFLNDLASNYNKGIWINDKIYDDEYSRRRTAASYAAFDTAMEEANKVSKIRERIEDPIDW